MSPTARFIAFLSVALTIWLLQHLYVGWRLLSIPVLSATAGGRAVVVILALGFLTYPLGRSLFALGGRGPGRVLEYLGGVWMGTLFLLLASLLLVELITAGGFLLRAWIGHLRGGMAVVALVAAGVAWIGGLQAPRLVEVELRLPALPAESDGISIVQISDVHLGTMLGRGTLEAIRARVEALAPDLLVITGDLIDGDAGVVEELLPELRRLRAPRGVFAVLGNHEYYAGRQRSRHLLREAGFTVLDNDAQEVAPGLWLAGTPDARGAAQTGEGEADLDAALAEVPDDAALVLLQHAPEQEERAAAAGVDLLLNGHTHGGQIWPFHLLVRASYRHYAGIYKVGEMTQVVSRGTGLWGPPMRLFASAEIVRVTLRAADP